MHKLNPRTAALLSAFGWAVGYLLAGIAIGPWGLGFISDVDEILHFSELGVVFLLFDIGLHFSLREIRTRRDDMIGLAPLQIILCGGAFALIGAVGIDSRCLASWNCLLPSTSRMIVAMVRTASMG